MSTILSLKQAPAQTLDLLLARPELAVVFWMNPDYTPPKTPALLIWIAKLLGHYEPPMNLPEAPPGLIRNGEELRLDRNTAMLVHTTGDQPLNELGQPIAGSDHGLGDDRALTPAGVAALATTLRSAVPIGMNDSLQQDFNRLRTFADKTEAQELGLVIQLS